MTFANQVLEVYHSIVHSSLRQCPFDASSRESFLSWQEKARRITADILGEMPKGKCDLNPDREDVDETDRYVQERIVYWTRSDLQVPAYLFRPKAVHQPAPAIICLHGHSARGKDETVDPASAYRGFGRRFAEEGCVVLCPDQIGLGERILPEGKVTYGVLTHGLNMLGHSLIGLRYWDLVRALDLLESFDAVDKERIGVMGLSLGGEMTLFLAGLQTRVRAACICGYLTSFRHTFLDSAHCTCGHLRDLAKYFEHIDLAALIAPRPLFVDSGREDTGFPTADAEEVVRDLRPVYALFGRPESCLGIEVHDGAHEISGRLSIPWMLERLKED